jgi:hypothetical protein
LFRENKNKKQYEKKKKKNKMELVLEAGSWSRKLEGWKEGV